MVYVVHEKTEYPLTGRTTHVPRRIIGRDFRHASEGLFIPESNRRQLENKGETHITDALGRRKTYTYKMYLKP